LSEDCAWRLRSPPRLGSGGPKLFQQQLGGNSPGLRCAWWSAMMGSK
jgi:hypothetical protein